MIPDKLVTAAAEAGHDAWMSTPQGLHGKALWRRIMQDALAAAFAKLPECEEVQPPYPESYYGQGWRACLAALARQFGKES